MGRPRVFADLHHADLYYSLQLLFEKRLGWELYRSIGLEWYHEGFWHVYPHIDTAKQYLDTETHVVPVDIHGKPLDERTWLNKNYTTKDDGIYYVTDPTKGKINRGVTLSRFKEMEFDILLSSIPSHVGPFNRLIELYQPKAKHIFQIGNNWSLNHNVKNIMASCRSAHVPPDKNVVFYHQEFDLDTFRYEGPARNPRRISSFIHYMQQPQLLQQLSQLLSGWEVNMYGAGMPQNSFCETYKIADAMREAGFIWHFKPGGDGFGHCYDDQTEVLTNKGWKLFKDVDRKDLIAALNQENGELVYEKPTEYFDYQYEGEMLHFVNRSIDLLVTPKHRMYIERYDKWAKSKGWRITEAENLNFMKPYYPRRAIGFKRAPDIWVGTRHAKYTVEWARFLGWYLSEGCCWVGKHKKKKYPTGHRVIIDNTNSKYITEIKSTLESLGYHVQVYSKECATNLTPNGEKGTTHRIVVTSKQLYAEVVDFGKVHEKYIPRDLLDSPRDVLQAFFNAFTLGDGNQETKDLSAIKITSKRLINDLQECAVKLGYRTSLKNVCKSKISKRDPYRLRSSSWRNYEKCYGAPKSVSYTGKVYCVSVPSGVILVRRKGLPVFCGNCIHDSYAVGRPVITRLSDYQGKLAEDLLIEDETFINIDGRTPESLYWELTSIVSGGRYGEMSRAAYNQFKKVVDFDAEFKQIKEFLGRLL